MKDSSKKFLWSPLGGFAEGFLAELSARGYSPRSSEAHLFLMKHLSRWLAAQGLSNTEVAQRLFVTRKTVETHLGSAYRKLAIASREELPVALGSSVT